MKSADFSTQRVTQSSSCESSSDDVNELTQLKKQRSVCRGVSRAERSQSTAAAAHQSVVESQIVLELQQLDPLHQIGLVLGRKPAAHCDASEQTPTNRIAAHQLAAVSNAHPDPRTLTVAQSRLWMALRVAETFAVLRQQ